VKRLWLACISILVVWGISGCAQARWPWFHRPGTSQEQQRRAQKYDPYPATTAVGGPPMEGVRPRDYDRPYTETQRDYFDRVNPGWGVEGRPQEVGR
jgi:hypothetical protein